MKFKLLNLCRYNPGCKNTRPGKTYSWMKGSSAGTWWSFVPSRHMIGHLTSHMIFLSHIPFAHHY